jgi:hypothetical protein
LQSGARSEARNQEQTEQLLARYRKLGSLPVGCEDKYLRLIFLLFQSFVLPLLLVERLEARGARLKSFEEKEKFCDFEVKSLPVDVETSCCLALEDLEVF